MLLPLLQQPTQGLPIFSSHLTVVMLYYDNVVWLYFCLFSSYYLGHFQQVAFFYIVVALALIYTPDTALIYSPDTALEPGDAEEPP